MNQPYKYPEPPIDLKPYLRNGLHVIIAEWFYRLFCQPVVNLLDKLEGRWTRKWCEDRIPLRERVK